METAATPYLNDRALLRAAVCIISAMPAPTSQDHYTQRIARRMIVAAWIAALVLLTLFFNHYLEERRNPNRRVQSTVNAEGMREVVLQRNRFGHYVAQGTINGKAVEFLIDTGASDVAIPADMARHLGLKQGRPAQYMTANGVVTAYKTVLDTLTLGDIELTKVRASINPAGEDLGILMGMSVLKRIEFTQNGDTLILRQAPPG